MIALATRPTWQRVALLLAIALILQTTLLHWAVFRAATPSATLVLVVWFALAAGRVPGMVLGLITGICEDALSYGTGGAWTISTALAGLFAGSVRGGFFTDSMVPAGAITFFTTLVRALVFWMVMAMQGYKSGLGAAHAHAALWQGVENALLYVLIILVMRGMDAWKRR